MGARRRQDRETEARDFVRDIALTETRGGVLAHRADCTYARTLAAMGEPVATMFGITRPLPADIPRHSCLEEGESDDQRSTNHGS